MPTYEIRAPNGKTYRIDGPAGASDADVRKQVMQQFPEAAKTSAPAAKPLQTQFPGLDPNTALRTYNNARDGLLRNFEGKTQQERQRALTRFDTDPRIQGIRKAAGLAEVRSRQEEIKDAGRRAASTGAPGFLTATKAALTRNLFGIPERLGAAGLYYSGNAGDLSYDETLEAIRARTDAEMRQSTAGSVVGAIAGGLVGAGASTGLVRGGGKLLTRAGASRAGNVLQGLTTARKGERFRNAGKIALAGAAWGGAQAAGEGSNVAEGALIGGVAAPVTVGLAKGAVKAVKGARNLAGFEPVESVLAKYVRTPPEQISAAMQERARQGLPSSIYEVLPLADRQALDDAIGKMPAQARERLAGAVRSRVTNMVQETNQSVQNVVRPIGPDRERARIASDLARSRGAKELPDAGDMEAAERAARSPLDMEDVAQTEARNIMRPYDSTVAYENVGDMVPQRPDLTPDGGVKMVETDPEIGAAIRAAAGPLRIADRPITVRDVTAIMSNLSRTAMRSNDDIQRGVAWRALDHLEQSMKETHPEIMPAIARMRAAYGSRMRMAEGVSEGARTRLRENVDPRGSDAASRNARNAYDTPEGSAGRALGQTSQLEREILTSPDASLRAINRIGTDPTMQEAISRNLGRQDVGDRIAQISRMQTEAARRLSGLDKEAAAEGGADTVHMLQNLMMMSPNTLPATKALALSRLVKGAIRIPERQAETLVDMLFSQNPTQISRAITALNRMDRRLLTKLDREIALSAGIGAVAGGEGSPETPVALPPEDQPTDTGMDSTETDAPQAEGDSPYTSQLQEVYDSEDPELLDLIDRVSIQESGGSQFDASGNVIQSSAGAIGVMQVMPQTAPEAARLAGLPWDENAYYTDENYNKLLGIAYLSEMLRRYDGDVQKALAAYNAGPGRLNQALADNEDNWLAAMPAETQNYVVSILS